MAKQATTLVTLATAWMLGGALVDRAATPPPDARVDSLVTRFAPEAIEIRHQLHQNPELSNRETKTAALVAEVRRKTALPYAYDFRMSAGPPAEAGS